MKCNFPPQLQHNICTQRKSKCNKQELVLHANRKNRARLLLHTRYLKWLQLTVDHMNTHVWKGLYVVANPQRIIIRLAVISPFSLLFRFNCLNFTVLIHSHRSHSVVSRLSRQLFSAKSSRNSPTYLPRDKQETDKVSSRYWKWRLEPQEELSETKIRAKKRGNMGLPFIRWIQTRLQMNANVVTFLSIQQIQKNILLESYFFLLSTCKQYSMLQHVPQLVTKFVCVVLCWAGTL